jgi:hypothetical protein
MDFLPYGGVRMRTQMGPLGEEKSADDQPAECGNVIAAVKKRRALNA